jgi:hypothetical protein
MFIACIGYVSYGVLPWIPFHAVIAVISDNGHLPPLVRYNEGQRYIHTRPQGNDQLFMYVNFYTVGQCYMPREGSKPENIIWPNCGAC